ncbi:MAG: hypothetical protein NTV51_12515 [Verrucomicrobia bacterium]|nr:hypothetical protein [Verrucomicrobiota bacterium]
MNALNDGLAELAAACAEEKINLLALIGRTARWVHPDVFRELPVWYPERWRRQPAANSAFTKILTNTNPRSKRVEEMTEANIYAERALVAALGLRLGEKPCNWSVCHIWGIDDPGFTKPNTIVQDGKFYSCVGNMILLPTPLKGLTDSDPEAKESLRVRAFELYRWVCPIDDAPELGRKISEGWRPERYPAVWRDPELSSLAIDFAQARKAEILRQLTASPGPLYPTETVRSAVGYWTAFQTLAYGETTFPAVESSPRPPHSSGDTPQCPDQDRSVAAEV